MDLKNRHFQKLENVYLAAAINRAFQGTIRIKERHAEISAVLSNRDLNPANIPHGSVIFKLLDDAACFAANSTEEAFFLVTVNFTVNFCAPPTLGPLRSIGKLKKRTANLFFAESKLIDSKDREVAFGSGIFSKSKSEFDAKTGYCLPDQ